jgi:hypothetical protein
VWGPTRAGGASSEASARACRVEPSIFRPRKRLSGLTRRMNWIVGATGEVMSIFPLSHALSIVHTSRFGLHAYRSSRSPHLDAVVSKKCNCMHVPPICNATLTGSIIPEHPMALVNAQVRVSQHMRHAWYALHYSYRVDERIVCECNVLTIAK